MSKAYTLDGLSSRSANAATAWRLAILALAIAYVACMWGLMAGIAMTAVVYLSMQAGLLLKHLNNIDHGARPVIVDVTLCVAADEVIARRRAAIESVVSEAVNAGACEHQAPQDNLGRPNKPVSPGVILARPRAGMGVGLVVSSLLTWSRLGTAESTGEPVVRPAGRGHAATEPAMPWYRRVDKR